MENQSAVGGDEIGRADERGLKLSGRRSPRVEGDDVAGCCDGEERGLVYNRSGHPSVWELDRLGGGVRGRGEGWRGRRALIGHDWKEGNNVDGQDRLARQLRSRFGLH